MQHVFFLNFVKVPFRNYDNLTDYGIFMHGRNFYLEEIDGVRLGCWHVLPKSISKRYEQPPTSSDVERALSEPGYDIMVYLHGNTMDRTTTHRVQLYNVLSLMDFHVLAIDYRGYGDSDGFPTEIGLTEDAKAVIKYARKLAGKNRLFVWGHSMGTGVATSTVMDLSESGLAPIGLVLESGFNNLRDVIYNHPFVTPFRWLPWFDDVLVKPLLKSGLIMSTDTRIGRVSCPILMLHAADDHVVPVILGRRLRDAAVGANRDVRYVEFEAYRNLRHKFIHLAEELPTILKSFVDYCVQKIS